MINLHHIFGVQRDLPLHFDWIVLFWSMFTPFLFVVVTTRVKTCGLEMSRLQNITEKLFGSKPPKIVHMLRLFTSDDEVYSGG